MSFKNLKMQILFQRKILLLFFISITISSFSQDAIIKGVITDGEENEPLIGGNVILNTGVGAGAEEILIPEENLGLERLVESLKRSKATGKSSSIVIVAEGDKTGKNVFELKDYVDENLEGYDARVSVLGHLQRGGSPSCFDRVLASRMGVKAVDFLLENKTNLMVGLKDGIIELTPLEKAIKGKTSINKELLRVSDIMSI